MFTGIVESLATVREIRAQPPGKRIVISSQSVSRDATAGRASSGTRAVGDSIAINGCCLTLVTNEDDCLGFDVGPETLARTNLGELTEGSLVNLEPSLRVGDPLGGHFVSGHVEAVGQLLQRTDEDDWSTFWFRFPRELGRYMVGKGSIAVDGVSLTLLGVEADRFSVALIPHTLAVTTLGALRAGDRVNLETDLLAKYAQKQTADVP